LGEEGRVSAHIRPESVGVPSGCCCCLALLALKRLEKPFSASSGGGGVAAVSTVAALVEVVQGMGAAEETITNSPVGASMVTDDRVGSADLRPPVAATSPPLLLVLLLVLLALLPLSLEGRTRKVSVRQSAIFFLVFFLIRTC